MTELPESDGTLTADVNRGSVEASRQAWAGSEAVARDVKTEVDGTFVPVGQARTNLVTAGVAPTMLPDWLLEVVLTEHGSFEAAERDYLARAHEKKMSVPSFEQVIFQFGMAVLSSDEHVRERFVAGVSALAPELAREEAILLMSMPFVVVVWGRSRDGMEKHAFVRKLPEDWRNRLGDLGLRIYTGIALGRLS